MLFKVIDTGQAWVMSGPASSIGTFEDAARRSKRRVCYFGVEQGFVDAYQGKSLCIGERPVWNPQSWQARVGQNRGISSQIRRAISKQVVLSQVQAADLNAAGPLRLQTQQLMTTWLASRRSAPMGFVLKLQPETYLAENQYWVAQWQGECVGFLSAAPINDRRGWFIQHFLRGPRAPNGSVEYMVDAAMRAFADIGSRYVTMGLTPGYGDVPFWMRVARPCLNQFYNFEGLRQFKAKLLPNRWDPIFLAYPKEQLTTSTLFDVFSAFSSGKPVRFAAESLLKQMKEKFS